MTDAIANLITTYHELNASVVDELSASPTALEFVRYVAKNRPFVVRGAASNWPAVQKWNADYLLQVMGAQQVNVAVTPHGNADAVVQGHNESLIFVEPFETLELFSDFLQYVREDTRLHRKESHGMTGRNVKYAQTQNDNLRSEYSSLLSDVPKGIFFASDGLDKSPDAINLWIGNHRSITSLHKDNYENVYVQIRGEKHFVLLPPVEMPCVNEQMLPKGRYRPSSSTEEQSEGLLIIGVHDEDEPIPVAVWDPDVADERETQYSSQSEPLRVTLKEGDMLYLPAMWYHKVSQTAGNEDFASAVNYWYDMDFDGSFWAQNHFIRDVMNASKPERRDGSRDHVIQGSV